MQGPTTVSAAVIGTPISGQAGGIVYAELDLAHQEQLSSRRLNEDKTEYAEILYTKPDEQHLTHDK